MRFFNECYPCILRQALTTANLVGLNESQAQTVMHAAMEYLLKKNDKILPLHIVTWINTYIRNAYFGSEQMFDPYRDLKRHSNDIVLQYMPRLEEMVRSSLSPLETAIRIAAVGNIIDFGARDYKSVDIIHEIENMENVNFGIYHYKSLFKNLCRAKRLLYIGDNAGEIVFDKVLVREIKKDFPALDITFAVRERPILNDATIEDARFVGLDREVTVISSGSVYPGTILEETNEAFRELFASADVIIAKGQGNFESLNGSAKENLFYLFRVKCDRIAAIIGAKNGSLVLYENNSGILSQVVRVEK